jgi:hypothetical protein
MSTASPAAKKPGKSLTDFRAAHDKSYIVPNKIRAALKQLGDGWEYEMDFMRIAGLSVTDLAAYREPFEKFTVLIGGRNAKRVWFGSEKAAADARAMV